MHPSLVMHDATVTRQRRALHRLHFIENAVCSCERTLFSFVCNEIFEPTFDFTFTSPPRIAWARSAITIKRFRAVGSLYCFIWKW